MSKVELLIKELCPDGVPYLAIGDIADCFAGATPSSQRAEYWTNGTIPWMSSGEVNKKLIIQTDKLITQEAFDSCSTRMIPANSVVIALAGQGKTRGLVARTRIELCTNQSLCSLVPKGPVSSDFLYYYLSSHYVQLRSASSGDGTRGGLNLQIIKSYLVPAPPAEVQHEIVQILDSFAQLEAELEAELEARKKQYEFYRNQLLTFPLQGGVRWVPMGDIARIRNGSDWKSLPEGEIPVYGSGGVMAHVGSAVGTGPSVLIPRKGSLGNLFYVDEPFWTVDTCFYTEINADSCIPKYLYYFLKTQDLAGMNLAGGVPSLTQTQLNKVLVPMPPLDEQGKIVAVLDKFDALVNDISSGLPAELKARRKQYEYYRDKLLTFKELED